MEFRHGVFENSAIETLEIYNDGLIISSRSNSDFLDHFLLDLHKFISEDLELSIIPTNTVNRLYESALIFETNKDILGVLNSVNNILPDIQSALIKNSNLAIDYVPFGIAFAADQTQNPHLKPVPFRVERRAGVEFLMNQYFATAPLTTAQHLAVIEKLEASS